MAETIYLVMDCRRVIARPAHHSEAEALKHCDQLNKALRNRFEEFKGDAWKVEPLEVEA